MQRECKERMQQGKDEAGIGRRHRYERSEGLSRREERREERCLRLLIASAAAPCRRVHREAAAAAHWRGAPSGSGQALSIGKGGRWRWHVCNLSIRQGSVLAASSQSVLHVVVVSVSSRTNICASAASSHLSIALDTHSGTPGRRPPPAPRLGPPGSPARRREARTASRRR